MRNVTSIMINKSNTRPMMVFIALLTFLPIANCDTIKKTILGALGASEKYKPEGNSKQMVPVFNVNDATRNRIEIRLNEIAGGFEQPTDMQFPPGEDDFFLLAEKKGKLK
ncbi:MAG: dehydrogenase, partial [Leptospira sp.]|nr:dehydrogenase [Leptospira sp.]